MGDTVGGGTSNSGCQCPFQEVELHSQDPEQPGAGPGDSPPVLTTEGNWQPWQLQLLETLHPWFQFRVVSRLLPLPGEGPNEPLVSDHLEWEVCTLLGAGPTWSSCRLRGAGCLCAGEDGQEALRGRRGGW